MPDAIGGVGGARPVPPAGGAGRAHGAPPAEGFDRILRERLRPQTGASAGEVRWSAHAQQRMAQRQIDVTPEVQQRLEGAVDRAAAKGARESLVLMDDVAVVVSVVNRTVITAVDRAAMRDHVFTNIDSAVLT